MNTKQKEIFISNIIVADCTLKAFMKTEGMTSEVASAAYIQHVLGRDPVTEGNVTRAIIDMAIEGSLPELQLDANTTLGTIVRPFMDVVMVKPDQDEREAYLEIVHNEFPKISAAIPAEVTEEIADQVSTGVNARFAQYVSKRSEISGIIDKMEKSAETVIHTKPHLVEYLGIKDDEVTYTEFKYAKTVSKATVSSMFDELQINPELTDIRKLALTYHEYGYPTDSLKTFTLENSVIGDIVNTVVEKYSYVPEAMVRTLIRIILDPSKAGRLMDDLVGEYDIETVIKINDYVNYGESVVDIILQEIKKTELIDFGDSSNVRVIKRVLLSISALLQLIRSVVLKNVVLFENDLLNPDAKTFLEQLNVGAVDIYKYRAVYREKGRITQNMITRVVESGDLAKRYDKLRLRQQCDCSKDIANIKIDELVILVMGYAHDQDVVLEEAWLRNYFKTEYARGLSVEDALFNLVFETKELAANKLMGEMHLLLNRYAMVLAKDNVDFTTDVLEMMDNHVLIKITNRIILAATCS